MVKKLLVVLNNKLMSSTVNDVWAGFDNNCFNQLSKELESNNHPIHRSFLQYKAQFNNNTNIMWINIVLLLLAPLFLIIPLIWYICYRWTKIDNQQFDYLVKLPYLDIIPNHLLGNTIKDISADKKKKYIFIDLLFCYKVIFKYLFFPVFWLKSIYTIFQYSGVAKIQAKEILVSNEYAFTSSVLTHYLHKYEKKVANCMHGEKVLCLRDCFSYYDTFYVWDSYYIDLLTEMKVSATFEVIFCKFIEFKEEFYQDDEKEIIVFFLQGIETLEDLNLINEKLKKLSIEYKKEYYVKPHPRYLNDSLYEVFSNEKIWTGGLDSSINKAFIVVSNYSTVLFQVYINRERSNLSYPLIVINDLIHLPERYIMLSKANIRFSQI